VDAERAVERARYGFTIGATRPFDEVYPRSVFERRVARQIAAEAVLKRAFGIAPTAQIIRDELERIEQSTKEPDQWAAVKSALGNDRSRIEQVVCRPLVVARALRARFAFDRRVQAEPHQRARWARATFQAGAPPPSAKRLRLRGGAEGPPTTTALLDAAKADARRGPRVLDQPAQAGADQPEPISPQLATVLEKELRKPGDVTTILEERDQFEVLGLISRAGDVWTVDAVRVPKRDFESWFAEQRGQLPLAPAPAVPSASGPY